MGIRTGIQWCDSTVNPTTGCDGCELWRLLGERADTLRNMGGPCYAGNYQQARLSKALPHLYSADFTEVRMAPGRMAKASSWSNLTGTARPDKPWLDGMPRIIFVGDMGDIFSADVSFEYLAAELVAPATSIGGSRHIWMCLTKRPRRAVEFAAWLKSEMGMEWPSNIWMGTSVTSKASVGRLDWLAEHPASRLFASLEPLVEAVDVSPWLDRRWPANEQPACGHGAGRSCGRVEECFSAGRCRRGFLDLVIVGGMSGADATPFGLAWPRSIRDQCKAAGVPFFMKQMGSHPHWDADGQDDEAGPMILQCEHMGIDPSCPGYWKLRDSHGGDWDEWPDDLKIREFPNPVGAIA